MFNSSGFAKPETSFLQWFIQDRLGPVTTVVVFFGSTVSVILDLLSPLGPLLFIAVIASLIAVGISILVNWRNCATLAHQNLIFRTKSVYVTGLAFALFSAAAFASSAKKEQGGIVAASSVTARDWQRDKLNKIASNTEDISRKLDVANAHLQNIDLSTSPAPDSAVQALMTVDVAMLGRLFSEGKRFYLPENTAGPLWINALQKRDPNMPAFIRLLSHNGVKLNELALPLITALPKSARVEDLRMRLARVSGEGADYVGGDLFGWYGSPLFLAIWTNDAETYLAFLDAGCDPNKFSTVTTHHMTPLDLRKAYTPPTVIEVPDVPFITPKQELVRINPFSLVEFKDQTR